jgi:hypothetical protein
VCVFLYKGVLEKNSQNKGSLSALFYGKIFSGTGFLGAFALTLSF